MATILLPWILTVLSVPGASSSAYTPRGPRFSWDTIPCFFHSSNSSGPMSSASLALMAKFPMVTIEKFQGACAHRDDASPACKQEEVIVDVLRKVKALNSNVSTIFYYNSVLDFPQYKLHQELLAHLEIDVENASHGGLSRGQRLLTMRCGRLKAVLRKIRQHLPQLLRALAGKARRCGVHPACVVLYAGRHGD